MLTSTSMSDLIDTRDRNQYVHAMSAIYEKSQTDNQVRHISADIATDSEKSTTYQPKEKDDEGVINHGLLWHGAPVFKSTSCCVTQVKISTGYHQNCFRLSVLTNTCNI